MTDPENPSAGWYPDPTGRYQTRYWDGSTWTDQAADDGLVTVDRAGHPGPTSPPRLFELEPVDRRRRRTSRARLVLGAVLVLALLGAGAAAFLLLRDDEERTGTGDFSGEVDTDGLFVHRLAAPEDTVIMIEVAGGPDFNPVVGITGDETVTDQYVDFFGAQAFDFEASAGLFSPVDADNLPGRVLTSVGGSGPGQREFVVFPAPFAADLDVLVAGFDGVAGEFDLEVSFLHFEGPGDGEEYLQAYRGAQEISEFVTAELTEDIEFEYGSTPCPAENGSSERTLEFDDAFEQCIDPSATYTAVFDTSEGEITVELDTEATPGTVNNFVALARYHYYDGTELFRTDPSIGIIQGGSPTTQDPADPGPGYQLPDEGFDYGLLGGRGGPYQYEPGDLVMARSAEPDGAGAQFFFGVTEEVSRLDAQGVYVRFGRVVDGLEVLEAILALHQADPADPLGGGPSRTVTVETVTIEES